MNDARMTPPLDDAALEAQMIEALAEGSHPNPFALLGPHPAPGGRVIRALLPGAISVDVVARGGGPLLARLRNPRSPDLFEGVVASAEPYLLRIEWPDAIEVTEDPYSFDLLLGDLDLHLIGEGSHAELASCLGAVPMRVEGVDGVRFAVWAPNAHRVAVVGDFNFWDERRHAMRLRHASGIWELFIPRIGTGQRYKYAIIGPDGAPLPLKADPVARQAETAPATASIIADIEALAWGDAEWMSSRAARHDPQAPISIYEVHLASWLRQPGEESEAINAATNAASWDAAIERLIPYVADLGFTHIELMPVAEHPFGGSWGYQPTGLFAPSAHYGAPADFARFVDACHGKGIGVIVDWVPAHFPSDAHGLARFDGTALYEHQDPREGVHRDWDTLIYNFGRSEVRGFLAASALHWLRTFHLDGLRVDAVASMLYRNYSREPGEWIPNIHGGPENLEAVAFIRHVNVMVHQHCPGAMMIAEESTAWPHVTKPVAEGGLGFDYKWNMGWMHDTLRFMRRDAVHRRWHHDDIAFGLVYAFSENFVLPLSHDEVVHGKGSLLAKMQGDDWQKLASLRAYLGFMWTHPGKKLLFMGGEFGQWSEWDHDGGIERHLLAYERHRGLQLLVGDLNRVYRGEAALHQLDAQPSGFRWLIREDYDNSIFAYLRLGTDHAGEDMAGDDMAKPILVICNMTPAPQQAYRVGVPMAGGWRELVNSDSALYGGSDLGNAGFVASQPISSNGEPHSLELVVPPLATLILRHEGEL
ncbi:1,4-alpha-glucan branching enzyme [Rhizobiales bacterium GAS188]|nr:1,4-alpha-glucan branching enzyme [Rhizobiales bacterium GAS188]